MRKLAGPVMLLATLTGCGGAHPSPEELYGLWARPAEEGNIGVLDFAASDAEDPVLAGLSDVYHIYVYPEGTEPVNMQSGTFLVAEGDGWEIVWTVSYDPGGLYTGMSFGNPIAKFDGDSLTLASDDGSERVYSSVTAMP